MVTCILWGKAHSGRAACCIPATFPVGRSPQVAGNVFTLPDNPAETSFRCRWVNMRTFFQLLGDVLHQGPPAFVERLSPWIIAVLGGMILALMLYCWLTA
jgi:hypothetical protein